MRPALRFLPFAAVAAAVWFLLAAAPSLPPSMGSELRALAESDARAGASRLTAVLEIYKGNAKYIAGLQELATMDEDEAARALQGQGRTHKEIASSHLFDLAGSTIQSWPSGADAPAAWMAQVKEAGRTKEVVFAGPLEGTNGPVLGVAAAVQRVGTVAIGSDGRAFVPTTTVGVLGLEIPWDKVISLALAGADRKSMVLVDAGWHLLAGVPEEEIGRAEAEIPAAVRSKLSSKDAVAELTENGARTVYAASPVAGSPWRVVVRRAFGAPAPGHEGPGRGRAGIVAILALAVGAGFTFWPQRKEDVVTAQRIPDDAPTMRAPPRRGGHVEAVVHVESADLADEIAEFTQQALEARGMNAPVKTEKPAFRPLADAWNKLQQEELKARAQSESATRERDRLRSEQEKARADAREAAAPAISDESVENGHAADTDDAAHLAWKQAPLDPKPSPRPVQPEEKVKVEDFLFAAPPGVAPEAKRQSLAQALATAETPPPSAPKPTGPRERLGPTPELQKLLRDRLEGVTDDMDYDVALSFCVNINGTALIEPQGSLGIAPELLKSLQLTIAAKKGLITAVALDRKPRVSNPNTISGAQDKQVAAILGTKRFAVVPFHDRQRVRGVLVVGNLESRRALSDEDLTRLKEFAAKLSAEIDKQNA